MERIQVILQAECAADCREAMESARSRALNPERVSFGLALMQEPDKTEAAAVRRMGQVRLVCPSDDKWLDWPAMWQGEGYVLMGHPGMRFDRAWDMLLLRTLSKLQRQRKAPVLLTGCLPRPEDVVDAVCPVAASGFDESGRLVLTRGTPLRYAAAPIRGAFLAPDFCMGRAEAFQHLAEAEERSLAAFRSHYDVYTLHKPWIRLAWDSPLPCMDPAADPETAHRLNERFDLGLDRETPGIMAREGVFAPELTFTARVPAAVRVQELVRTLGNQRSRLDPLVVSAWLEHGELPDMDLTMVRLRRLGAIKTLPLLCYADSGNSRRVALSHPNVLEYKPRYGLPVTGRMRPEDMPRYARLCKCFLLAKSREKLLDHTHYIWMDMDYLSYPVYPRTALDWETVCMERIVMARVDGMPDPSMIVVPEERLLTLCHEITAQCEAILTQTGRLPEETELWVKLLRDFPEWFRLIDLPGQRELFSLTMTARGEEWLTKQ